MVDCNRILMTDSYKSSHFLQYPPGTTGMFSYLESRGGRYDQTVFFGLQYVLQKYLKDPITMDEVEEAKELFGAHGEPFPYEGWKYIVEKLGGRIPVTIRAVPEGLVVSTSNVLMTAESNDPNVFWVVNWLEAMLHRTWYPITVATQSWQLRRLIRKYLDETSDDPAGQIGFKLHDFGARGASSSETAALGGAAHLVSFMGTDTVEALALLRRHYGIRMAGFSIPAAEHSTITSWGKSGELDAYRNMVTQFGKPGGLFAVVSDSYDIYKAVRHHWGETLKDEVIKSGGTLVVRPDSGDPVMVVNQVVHDLAHSFGFTVNKKGYRVLHPSVRVIQGDGVNPSSIESILKSLKLAGFSAENIAFGMGGALLQKVDRDTQRFAFKCSQVTINGRGVDVFKDPITDPDKKSKKGRLDLVKRDDRYVTIREGELPPNSYISMLAPVFRNGEITRFQDFDSIRNIANEH